ncbi:hypothetical protein [Streptomyces sp. B6B3]|uniref:hypothetical protein n=1 Tax=Streptomyces sp. B6B3 TaxID=3153570 RepID=UPI00325D9FC5
MPQQALPEALSPAQQSQLATWLAQRSARLAAQNQHPAAERTLTDRLGDLDAAFVGTPDQDNPLAQENHELRRTVEIYEEAIRQLINQRLQPTGPTAP